jgi:hypothetical protein
MEGSFAWVLTELALQVRLMGEREWMEDLDELRGLVQVVEMPDF